MSERVPRLLQVAVVTLTLQGCGLVSGIFKAGFVTAIIVIVLLIALVGWVARAAGGRRPPPV